MHQKSNQFKRIILQPKDHGCAGKDLKWENLDEWNKDASDALKGKGPLIQSLRWNAGFYLWVAGISKSLSAGIEKADYFVSSGAVEMTLNNLIQWREKIKK